MSYSQKLEDRIDHYLIANEELIKNERLGWVGWLLNGNMCFGIYGDLLIVRMKPSLGNSLIQKKGIDLFKQADETAGTILSVKPGIYENSEALHKFIDHSMEYTATLPPKNEDQWSNHLE